MKKLFYCSVLALAILSAGNKTSAQNANTSLSNLAAPTKINVALLPDKYGLRNLGSAAKAWKNIYFDSAIYTGGTRVLAFTNNTAVGEIALAYNTTGTNNTATGLFAMLSNTTGSYNTANGHWALYSNTTGNYNTGLGMFALVYNSGGSYNTAIGTNTLYYNTGDNNTATGLDALYNNKTGYYNTANGVGSMFYNTTGINNTAIGAQALNRNTSGANNTGIGYNAMKNTTASQFNTAIGYQAGYSYDNGYNNVFVGANVDVNGNGYFNDIAIGQGTVCTGSSQVTMGNGATTSYRAYANWSNISDGRFKKNIKENVPGLAFINKLQPITYTLDATGIDNFLHQNQPQDKQASGQAKALMSKALAAKEKTFYTGFIAQDVEKAAKSLNYDFSGVDAAKNDKDLYGLRYAEFVVPLVKAVQELSGQNEKLKSQNEDLEKKYETQQQQIDELKAMTRSNGLSFNSQQSVTSSSASLEQNIPNPFSSATTIVYTLPQKFTHAQLLITDKSGKAVKQVTISGSGKGSLNVDAATLAAGAYNYSLLVDGKLISTKQMVLVK